MDDDARTRAETLAVASSALVAELMATLINHGRLTLDEAEALLRHVRTRPATDRVGWVQGDIAATAALHLRRTKSI